MQKKSTNQILIINFVPQIYFKSCHVLPCLPFCNDILHFCIYFCFSNIEAPWRKLNAAPVCFGAKDDQFGRFNVEVGGSVEPVKLIHVSGWVNCDVVHYSSTNWGCRATDVGTVIGTVITTSNDVILLPDFDELQVWYTLPEYNPDSKEIVFKGLKNPLLLSSGQELRIWYNEDLQNVTEGDNGGTTCADVYAMYT